MDMSPFVSSDPAVRADGWSPERKLRFLDRLAGCGNVRAASAAVGMSRESAYTLRRRDALFARGWAAALLLARDSRVDVLADKATEGIEEEVWYRGELRGTRRRFDARLLLAHIARLDKMVEEAGEAAAADVERFDEILACIAGAQVPEELPLAPDGLPLGREAARAVAERADRAAVDHDWAEREASGEEGLASDENYEVYKNQREAGAAGARAYADEVWDAWVRHACATVDTVLAGGGVEPRPAPETGDPDGAESSSGTVSEVSGSGPASSPGTVSDVSGSNACASFIGPDGNRYAHA